MILAQLTIVVSSLLGWQDISVQPSRGRSHSAYQRNVAQLDRPSERTIETLRRYDLEKEYRRDVNVTLATLERRARANPDAEIVYAIAEISWVEGRRLDSWRKAAAIDRYVDAVAYAFDLLLDPEVPKPQPADPRYRSAMELYNGGLERLIRATRLDRQIAPDRTIPLKVHGGELLLRVALRDSPWTINDLDKILLASDFEVNGLPTQSYQFGLGVPLIGVRLAGESGKGAERFYPPEIAFPLTAYLVPTSRLRDPNKDPGKPRECTLQLIDPVRVRSVGPHIPVESDLTTPLGYMWSRTDLNRFRWTGLLHPGEVLGRANLMLLRPYEPGKIPVVMVHGLISSPLAWIPMLNELLRDPTIQQRYQFFLYMYPTGVSIPIAAAMLRDVLREAERMYNPDGSDPMFNRMVLLGHSMGGILSHAMAVSSEDKFWQLNSDRRFDEINAPKPEILEELGHYLFFEPLPFVRRVVFLATPHRGSELSRGMVGRVGSGLISEPDHISSLLAQLIKDNPNAFDRRQFRRMPTSIETLEPDNPERPTVLMALRAMPPGPDVTFHSIIGSNRPAPLEQTTDGVVPYRSAHLDGVASELVVRSDHGVQKAPLAIQEVRRILYEHLGLIQGRPASAAPVAEGTGPTPTVR
jgi:pimeloyl-ACP methyl ester carboxylesterase